MSKSIQYNETEPQNVQPIYKQYDVLDFLITSDPSQDLLANSVALNFDLAVYDGSDRVTSQEVFFDKHAGAHCFIDSVQTSSANGQLEHISEYSRYVAMLNQVSKVDNDLFNTTDISELVAGSEHTIQSYCQGVITDAAAATYHTTDNKSVSLAPKCILNKMAGNLNFNKVDFIKLSITLNKNISALFSNDATQDDVRYEISNVKLSYNTVPTAPQQCVMNSILTMKQSINSANSNISLKVPGVASGCSAIFLKQASENDITKNNQKLDRLHDIKSVQMLFNDSINNNFISYSEVDYGEIVHNFVESVSSSEHNNVGVNNWKGQGFGIGQRWGNMIDLTTSKFNLQIQTNAGVSASAPYLINLYFYSMVVV
jgi:hypothetical protein